MSVTVLEAHAWCLWDLDGLVGLIDHSTLLRIVPLRDFSGQGNASPMLLAALEQGVCLFSDGVVTVCKALHPQTKRGITINPAIPHPWIFTRRLQVNGSQRHLHMFIAALFTVAE